VKRLDKKNKRALAETVLCELWFSLLAETSPYTSVFEEKRTGAADPQDMSWSDEMKKFSQLITGLEKKVMIYPIFLFFKLISY
jgi:hypothetical protein